MNKRFLGIVYAMRAILLIAGCGSGNNGNNGSASGNASGSPTSEGSPSASPSSSSSPEAAEYPRTITHAKGKTVLQQKPTKVAVTFFPYAEHLFAIGDAEAVAGVVGLKSLQNFTVYDPFVKDGRIQDLGDEANLEKIMAIQPDVIIAWQEDAANYEQLSKIAPTIVIPSSENWQDTIVKVADIVGDAAKAQDYIAAYDTKLNELASKLDADGLKGKTALFMMTWGTGFNYYYGKRLEPYYQRLGFSGFDKQEDYAEISLEGVAAWNPDYIFLAEDFTGSAKLKVADLEKDAVWQSLKAVKDNHVYKVDTEIVGPLAMGQFKGLEYMESIFGKK